MSSYQLTINIQSNELSNEQSNEQLDEQYLIDVSFDFYGNLYFRLNNNTYQLNVDAKNTPYLDHDNYDILNNNINNNINNNQFKLQKFNNYNTPYGTLSEKMQTMINDDSHNFYPEDNTYYMLDEETNQHLSTLDNEDIIDEDMEKQYGVFNKKFIFSHNSINDIIPINMRQNGDICALYDTYVYNETNLCFKSNSNDEISYYRIRLYNNGDLFFRPIGYSEKLYKLHIINDPVTNEHKLVLKI